MRERYHPIKSSPINLLIVEDVKIVALDLQKSLSTIGYNVIGIVSSGEKAVEKAVELKPDLILMDIMIEGDYDGIVAAEKINEIFDVPVIYLTAYVDERTLNRAKITTPYGYLLKPYDERILHITIEMAVYKHQVEKRLKENESWLATTLESIGDGVIATDTEGKIRFINPIAQNIIGEKKELVVNRSIEDILIVEDDKLFLKTFPEKLKNSFKEVANKKSVYIKNHAKKSNIPVDITLSPIKSENEIPIGAVLILEDITDRKKSEEEKEKLLNKVTLAQKRLEQLSRRLIEVQEAERRKVAYELHDEIGQSLTAIKFNTQSMLKNISDSMVIEALNEDIKQIDAALIRIRTLSSDLRPSMLDDLGLIPAIRSFADKQFNSKDLKINIINNKLDKKIPVIIENNCYRIAQELLINIKKHSNAKNIFINIWIKEDLLNLKISDDGKGFDVEKSLSEVKSGNNIGLLGINERVNLLGGKIYFNSANNRGTEVHAILPLLQPEKDH